MAHSPRGVSRRVTIGRRIVAEFLYQARNVPLVAIRREFAIPHVAAVRAETQPRVSWIALFTRAYGLAARRHAALRRNWMSFPWPRIYEHPVSSAAVLVERESESEDVVLGAKIHEPELMGLADIDRFIRHYQTAPVRSVSAFRQLLRIARLPGPLRRFAFWAALHWSGYRRCRRFGTFLVSSLGNFGCESTQVRMPLTGYLTFGPISADGRVSVGLTFDHRVMDGRTAARALEDMERILNTSLVAELWGLSLTTRSAGRAPAAAEAVIAG
jgi:hypothetical protein